MKHTWIWGCVVLVPTFIVFLVVAALLGWEARNTGRDGEEGCDA